jgi:hypothetical protein
MIELSGLRPDRIAAYELRESVAWLGLMHGRTHDGA